MTDVPGLPGQPPEPGLTYPPARREDIAERLHGHLVRDPYRWLEDPGSEETAAWLAAQDRLYAAQAAAAPGREALARRIGELLGARQRGGGAGPAGSGSCWAPARRARPCGAAAGVSSPAATADRSTRCSAPRHRLKAS